MALKFPKRFSRTVVLLIAASMFVTSCKRAEQPNSESTLEQAADSSVSDTSASAPPSSQSYVTDYLSGAIQEFEKHEVIDYPNFWENVQNPSNAFEPFAKLKAIAVDFIHHKDTFRSVGEDEYAKQEKAAYAAIMEYKTLIESGKYAQSPAVALLDIPRVLGDKDSSSLFLPEQRPSFFTNGNFFFLGGAPFVQRHIEYDTATNQEILFKDANGKPELRLAVKDTENVYHLFKSVMQFRKPQVKIDLGGPVPVYDGPMDEVKGIGSLIHNFVDDIPVVFLMENGIVKGHLKYYQEPFTMQYSCYSHFPDLIFSCSSDIDVNQIVGVYIPYDNHIPTTCSVTRPDRWNWSADLNNDSIPDIACVIGTYEGVGDGVPEMLWFININGNWKVVDYGEIPSCT
jgi:hypothetical protein